MSKTEELEGKVQFLGEKLIEEISRTNTLLRIVGELNDLVWEIKDKNEKIEFSNYNFFQTKNELTHLHNEVRDIQALLGIDGSVPKRLPGKQKQFKEYTKE